MCRTFMTFCALFSITKQTVSHNSKNAQPMKTKFQGLLNLYETHVWNTFSKHLINLLMSHSGNF